MTAKLIDGKMIAEKIYDQIKSEIYKFKVKGLRPPGLAVVIVGDNPASQIYVRNKKKICKMVGIEVRDFVLNADISEEDLVKLIRELNSDSAINGILVQLPLPEHINSERIIDTIISSKDVDGFNTINYGKLLFGKPTFIPCTPLGIMEILKYEGVDIKGKHAVIVGRSNIVGKPTAILLMSQHATITICHSRTVDLPSITRQAQILVVAIGKAGFITYDMVSDGAVVIDVGMNRVEGKLVGDVDFEAVKEKAGLITPVPGGVGPMTIAMLMRNTLQAYRESKMGE